MRLVQNWWKVLLVNIIWLGSLLTIVGGLQPLLAKLGAEILSTVCIILALTMLGKQTQQLNMWLHRTIAGKEPTFFGKSREEIEGERTQVKELIFNENNRKKPEDGKLLPNKP